MVVEWALTILQNYHSLAGRGEGPSSEDAKIVEDQNKIYRGIAIFKNLTSYFRNHNRKIRSVITSCNKQTGVMD